MKKILLLLLTLLLFAPPGRAAEEISVTKDIVYVNDYSTAGYSTTLMGTRGPASPGPSSKASIITSIVNSSSYYLLYLELNNPTNGVKIKFQFTDYPEINQGEYGYYSIRSGSAGLRFAASATPATFRVISEDPTKRISKFYFRATNATARSVVLENVTEGTWTEESNEFTFTPSIPSTELVFKTGTNAGNQLISRITTTVQTPISAPEITGVETAAGKYPSIDDDGVYQYLTEAAEINLKAPEGAVSTYCTWGISENIPDPTENSTKVEMDASGYGKVKLDNVVVGQVLYFKAVSYDSEGQPSIVLSQKCKRVALEKPEAPKVVAYSTDGQFDNYLGQISLVINSGFSPVSGSTITLPSEQLILKVNGCWYTSAKSITYAVSDSPDPTGLDFDLASVRTDTDDPNASNVAFNLPSRKKGYNDPDWSELSYPKPVFFVDDASMPRAECYLHLKGVNGKWSSSDPLEKAESEIVTIKLRMDSPAAPVLNLTSGTPGTWSSRGSSVPSLSYVAGSRTSVDIDWNPGTNNSLYYGFQAKSGDSWPGEVPAAYVTWSLVPEVPFKLANMNSEGRLYVKVLDNDYNQYSGLAMLDLEPIQVSEYRFDLGDVVDEQELVKLTASDGNIYVTGAYATDVANKDGRTTYYLYLSGTNGSAIKAVIQSATEPAVFTTYKNAVPDGKVMIVGNGSIVGRMHYNTNSGSSKGMPELWVTPGAEDYIAYLPQGVVVDPPVQNLKFKEELTEVSAADFNKYVTLRSLTWLGGNRVRTADGTELSLYSRLAVPGYDFAADMANVAEMASTGEGKLFAATGRVGQLNGYLALLTTGPTVQCPGTPSAYAPNLIAGTPDENGFIQVNAISSRFYIDIVGHANGETVFEVWNGDRTAPGSSKVGTTTHNGRTAIDVDFGTEATGERSYWIYGELNGMLSLNPLKLHINKYEATPVRSIKEFKEAEASCTKDHGKKDEETRYQMLTSADGAQDGMVVIEAMTPEYIYVRDYPVSATAEADDNWMHTLLIRNENKWEANVTKGDVVAPLEVGDVITGFALRPRHDRGNILSNSTGYARTFKWVEHIEGYKPEPVSKPVNYGAETTDPSGTDFRLAETDRMTLVTIEGVKVTKDGDRYVLNIAGPETELTFDIFTTRGGWVESYAADATFNITGVILRASADEERYALAPISFTGAGKLSTPEVYWSEIESSLRGELEQPYIGGSVVMKPVATTIDGKPVTETAENPITIHYSIDGLDPLNNIGSRIKFNPDGPNPDLELGERTIEVRAFAAQGGMTPSDVVVRRFTKNSSDVQYILNFLNTARENNFYRFTSNLKVVAIGGKYMFVAGPVGHFLPIYKESGWDDVTVKEGQYVGGFTVGYKEDEHDNRLAVATNTAGTFVVTDEEDVDEDARITATPDVLNRVTSKNARRYVTLMNVQVNKIATTAPVTETQWTVTELSDGQVHPMIVGRLGEVDVYCNDADGNPVAEELQDGQTYNVTGFVMLGANSREGIVEFWPMRAQRVSRTAGVTATVKNAVSEVTDTEGEKFVTFDGSCEVTLNHNGHNATIYYWLESETKDQTAATWFVYQRPFIVNSNERVHAKAQEPGAAESDHTHITLTRLDMSASPVISATDGLVTITAANGAEITWWTSADESKHTYSAPFTVSGTVIVYATAKEADKALSPVAHLLVVDPATVAPDPAKVSGKVKATIDDSDPAKVVVTLEPEEDLAPGSFEIWYAINPTEECIPGEEGNMTPYTQPIDCTEGGRMVAILIENGKLAGKPADISIWLIPTDIEGVDAERREDEVRAEGGDIIAPEGSEVYDITGRKVNPTGLRSGIYIVRTPGGKSVKIRI